MRTYWTPTSRHYFEQFVLTLGDGPQCIPWPGRKNPNGYGLMGSSKQQAHRYIYELSNGPIPGDMDVLHRCDNPPCVRLDHLWLGTQNDNNRDAARKGRSGWSGIKTLTTDDISEIRTLRVHGDSLASISRRFDISRRRVESVLYGKVHAPLGREIIAAIRERGVLGESQSSLSRSFGISRKLIIRALRGEDNLIPHPRR